MLIRGKHKMIMPNAMFHFVAYSLINHYLNEATRTILVGDCKPAKVETVEDNRTDFTLKVLHRGELLCYLVFRMTAFANTDSFDMLSNVKVYGPSYNMMRELTIRDYPDAGSMTQALMRVISSLI